MNEIAHTTAVRTAHRGRRRAAHALSSESAWDSPEAFAGACRGLAVAAAVSLLLWLAVGLAVYAAVRAAG